MGDAVQGVIRDPRWSFYVLSATFKQQCGQGEL